MLTQAPELINEPTLGFGNCAFNAFALALHRVLPEIEKALQDDGLDPDNEFAEFLELAKDQGLGGNWAAIRKMILDSDTINLQNRFAPILRQLAVKKSETFYKSEAVLDSLSSSLNDYITPISGGVHDDIFIRHPFIENKFAELKQAYKDVEAMNTALLNWWLETGYMIFMQEMCKASGENIAGTWAGDIELGALADYFRVNLIIKTPTGIMAHQIKNGALSAELQQNEELQAELLTLNVINKDDCSFNCSKEVLAGKLDPISNIDSVIEVFLNADNRIVDRNVFTEECVNTMLAKGLIKEIDPVNIQCLDSLFATQVYVNKKEIMDCFKHKPEITLQHDANHWSNCYYNTDVAKRQSFNDLLSFTFTSFAKKQLQFVMSIWEKLFGQAISEHRNNKPAENKNAHTTANTPPKKPMYAIPDFYKQMLIKREPDANVLIKDGLDISPKTQIELDKQYALKLQQDEYYEYSLWISSAKVAQEQDEKFAIQLHNQLNGKPRAKL